MFNCLFVSVSDNNIYIYIGVGVGVGVAVGGAAIAAAVLFKTDRYFMFQGKQMCMTFYQFDFPFSDFP